MKYTPNIRIYTKKGFVTLNNTTLKVKLLIVEHSRK